jgi:hypothetical protein
MLSSMTDSMVPPMRKPPGAAIAALSGEMPAAGGFLIGGTMLSVMLLSIHGLMHCRLYGTTAKNALWVALALFAGLAASWAIPTLAGYAITLETYGVILLTTSFMIKVMNRIDRRQLDQARARANGAV